LFGDVTTNTEGMVGRCFVTQILASTQSLKEQRKDRMKTPGKRR